MAEQAGPSPLGGTAPSSIEHDPAFLERLGAAHLSAGLPEHALEAFSQIPPDDTHYPDALIAVMGIHQDAKNWEALQRAAEEAYRREVFPLWAMRNLGLARGWQGDTVGAAHCFRQALEYLPTNAEVQEFLAGVRAGHRRPDIRTLIREALPWGLRPHGILDCIGPLVWEGRAVTCGFEDIMGFAPVLEREPQRTRGWFLTLTRQLYEQLGISTGFLRYLVWTGKHCLPGGKLVFSRSPSIYAALRELEGDLWAEYESGSGDGRDPSAVMDREGALFGYPACCTDWATRSRRTSTLPYETPALADLVEEETKAAVVGPSVPPPSLAYFAYEFYPCHPRCPAAEAVGRDILTRYAAGDRLLAKLFEECIIPFNKGKIWQRSVRYPDYVEKLDMYLFGLSRTRWDRMKGWAQHFQGRVQAVIPGMGRRGAA